MCSEVFEVFLAAWTCYLFSRHVLSYDVLFGVTLVTADKWAFQAMIFSLKVTHKYAQQLMCFLKSKELMLFRADKIKVAILKNYYLLFGDCLADNNVAWDIKVRLEF